MSTLITFTLKSLPAIRAIRLALSSETYSQIALFFALNRIFFPANEKRTLKQHNQTDFRSNILLQVSNLMAGKNGCNKVVIFFTRIGLLSTQIRTINNYFSSPNEELLT